MHSGAAGAASVNSYFPAYSNEVLLKLRTIGLSDYSVLEGRQRIGRIRLATERMPCVWVWSVSVHLPGELPMGSAKDLYTAKLEFKAAWQSLKARTPLEQLAAAYKAMNIRDEANLSGRPHCLRMRRAMLSACSESRSRLLTSMATEWRDRFGWSFQMASASLCHRRHCAARLTARAKLLARFSAVGWSCPSM